MTKPNRIIKHEVPIDFEPHELTINRILHIDQQHKGAIALWTREQQDQPPMPHVFLVVGTGHEIPDQYDTYFGTTLDRVTGLVWHLVGYATPQPVGGQL